MAQQGGQGPYGEGQWGAQEPPAQPAPPEGPTGPPPSPPAGTPYGGQSTPAPGGQPHPGQPQQPYGGQPYPGHPQQPYGGQGYPPYGTPPGYQPYAIPRGEEHPRTTLGFVLALVGGVLLVFFGWFGIPLLITLPLGVLGAVFGHQARRAMNEAPGRYRNEGLATAAIVIGWLTAGLSVIGIILGVLFIGWIVNEAERTTGFDSSHLLSLTWRW